MTLSDKKIQFARLACLEGVDRIKETGGSSVQHLSKFSGISRQTGAKWDNDKYDIIREAVEAERRKKEIREALGNNLHQEDIEGDEDATLVRKINEMDEAVFSAGKINKIAKMAELWYKRKGLLIEKSLNVEVKLSADDIARQHLENRKWLREQGYLGETGSGQVQPEPPLLSE